MKQKLLRLRLLLPVSLMALLAVFAAGCRKEKQSIASIDGVEDIPSMTTRDVETLISDSGYTRYKITAPLWLIYDNVYNPKWRFPEGLDMQKFDLNMVPDARILCDSATYFSDKKLWRLDGNVRMKNAAGDKFLTRQLFWNQNTRTIYSDSFIHIERTDRILEGFGFTSDEQMSSYSIRKPSGIFPVPERNKNRDAGENDADAQTIE